jgi:hypothetical protein
VTNGIERVRVRVLLGPHLLRIYSADPVAAERYVAAMRRSFAGLQVSIDGADTGGLRPLPSEILWTIAP